MGTVMWSLFPFRRFSTESILNNSIRAFISCCSQPGQTVTLTANWLGSSITTGNNQDRATVSQKTQRNTARFWTHSPNNTRRHNIYSLWFRDSDQCSTINFWVLNRVMICTKRWTRENSCSLERFKWSRFTYWKSWRYSISSIKWSCSVISYRLKST